MAAPCFCENQSTHLEYQDNPGELKTSVIHLAQDEVPIPWGEHITCGYTAKEKSLKTVWPAFDNLHKINLVESAADFYLLEHIIHQTGIHGLNKSDVLIQEFLQSGFAFNDQIKAGELALARQAELEERVGNALKEYLHYATVCEMGHSWPFSRSFSGERPRAAFWAWGKVAKHYGRAQCAQWAVEVFELPWRNHAFGGWRWAAIAKVLLAAEQGEYMGARFDNHLFLDRVFSLQHNTGGVFNKFQDWAGAKVTKNWDPWTSSKPLHSVDNLWFVLEAHHIGDIATLNRYASSYVQHLHMMTGETTNPITRSINRND